MKATKAQIAEFIQMHDRYRRASERMLVLQASVAEGMRKIGEGCTTQASKDEFSELQGEIERSMAGMKEICESLDR